MQTRPVPIEPLRSVVEEIEVIERRNPVQRVMLASVWATNADHAIKIVNEKRGQAIAAGEFKPQPHKWR